MSGNTPRTRCPAGDGLGDHESQHFDGHWRCLRCGYHPADCCGDNGPAQEEETS
jgi:hypothetical protein